MLPMVSSPYLVTMISPLGMRSDFGAIGTSIVQWLKHCTSAEVASYATNVSSSRRMEQYFILLDSKIFGAESVTWDGPLLSLSAIFLPLYWPITRAPWRYSTGSAAT